MRAAQPRLGWTTATLRHLLSSRLYEGLVLSEGQWTKGALPALVDAQDAAAARALVSKRKHSKMIDYQEDTAGMFSGGLLHCPHCTAQGIDSILYAYHQPVREIEGRSYGPYRAYICARYHSTNSADRRSIPHTEGFRHPSFRLSEPIARSLMASELNDRNMTSLAVLLGSEEDVLAVRRQVGEIINYAIPSVDKKSIKLVLRPPTG